MSELQIIGVELNPVAEIIGPLYIKNVKVLDPYFWLVSRKIGTLDTSHSCIKVPVT